MPILVTCSCGKSFRAQDAYARKEVRGLQCGRPVTIAGPSVAPYDAFLSYSSKDKAVADAAVASLEARGLRCWIAPRDIVPGQEWSEAILAGLEQSRLMVLIFSANSNASPQ